MAVRVLGGRYELVAFVGRGGMGEVWEGRDRVIERRVAVKLLPHDRRDTSGAELLFREARTAGGLSHAGVVTVFDLGQDPEDGTLYLVMEYLPGRDLDTVLREDGPPEPGTATDWAAQTAAALHVAHEAEVVHRDLKPANLMLGPDGRIKILDFGVARYMESTHKSSKVIGTLAYMPPERFGDLPGDARSDLYSLGCVLHELLTGHIPFQATGPVAMMAAHLHREPVAPSDIRPGVPAALDDLVLALLAKNPDHRPSTAAEVHDRLRELPTQTAPHGAYPTVGTPAHRPPVGPPPQRRRVTRRTALRLGVAAAIGAGATTALALFDQDHLDPRIRWRYATGGVASSPVAVGGELYVGSTDKKVYALDAATGTKKWAFDTGGEVSSTPAVASGMVYVGSADGYIHALDRITGAEAWAFDTGNPVTNRSLAADGGTVYGCDESTGATGSKVYALDAATGTAKWAVEHWAASSPTVAHGLVYFGDQELTRLYALDAATGATKWTLKSDGTVYGMAVADGILYFTCGESHDGPYARVNSVSAVNAATGAFQWNTDQVGPLFTTPAVANRVVYVNGRRGDGKIYALNANGTRKWVFGTGGKYSSSPTLAGGVVYVGSDEKVYALDATTGAEKWVLDTGGKVSSTPAVADGVVYVSRDKYVYALDAANEANQA
ncbi:PQQ-binding-like beta-propeller repeat protein [Streptomyces sp. NPDC127117]|uniref:serine/threonine-protein kinase n=1 Tax=Streptomyces sp. NPDC127117 TaxID=3345368 RepID=UPI0036410718